MQAQAPEVSSEKATTAADLRLVSVEQLQKIHRELDACQKVIWLAGCRPRVPGGFDPAYVTGAQEQLKVIEELIKHQSSWTHDKPTQPGAYWIRGNLLRADALIEVKLVDDELWCNLHLVNTEHRIEYGFTIDQLSPDFEWLGPLQARAALSVREAVPEMVDFSPVPDDYRSQANGYRAGWNDCRATIAAAPSPSREGE